MKHRLLLPSLLLIATLPAQAQRLYSNSIVRTEGQATLQAVSQSEIPFNNSSAPVRKSTNPHAKVTGATIYSQSFATLPAGWTMTANAGCVNGWRWANAAPSGTGNNFPIKGLINSSTKSNGWLLYNADSVINNAGSTRPIGGSITSAAIPVGASHSNVMLSFEQYYRHSNGDTCFVDVSKDGTTWTSFPIYPNLKLSQYGFLYMNPTLTTLNISSVVGGQANAYIRFRFNSTAPTYSFNWLIDDLMLYDADATDLGLSYSAIASGSAPTSDGFTSAYSYSTIPLQFADTVRPVTYLSNYGLSAASNTVITARYFLNNALVNTATTTIASSPVEARDSAIVFGAGYKPTAAGNYVVALSMSPAGDAVAANNVDTIRFAVTDTVYATHGTEFTEQNCYLYRAVSSAPSYWGARFTISNGKTDTISSVSVAFRPETQPGERVVAQVYQATGSGTTFNWIPVVASATITLTAANIPTSGNVVYTSIPFRAPGGNYSSLILGDGDYAIVLTTVNSTKDVVVYSMVPPLPTAPDFIGYQGQSDVSPNDGSFGFASGGGIATGIVAVPLVHPNFGKIATTGGVHETSQIELGTAFPNPADNTVHIPFALRQTGNVQLVLTNSIGEVIDRIDLGRKVAGSMQNVSITTQNLPEGVYFYTIRTEIGMATGRIIVRH
jgi:hypothetical protein